MTCALRANVRFKDFFFNILLPPNILNDFLLLQTAFLEVVIPPDILNEETSGDMMVPEGGSAKLVCKSRGYPPPKIVWRREDGGDIISRGGPQGKTKGNYNFNITSNYRCTGSLKSVFTDTNMNTDFLQSMSVRATLISDILRH